MSKMKELYTDIVELMDTTVLSIDQIAKKLSCPRDIVCQVVEDRWNERKEFFSESSLVS